MIENTNFSIFSFLPSLKIKKFKIENIFLIFKSNLLIRNLYRVVIWSRIMFEKFEFLEIQKFPQTTP